MPHLRVVPPKGSRVFITKTWWRGAEVFSERAKEEERFLSAQADTFAGAKAKEVVGPLRSE